MRFSPFFILQNIAQLMLAGSLKLEDDLLIHPTFTNEKIYPDGRNQFSHRCSVS
jgi:hypothetical protein